MNFKTSKQAEENYLKKTLEVVKSNVENYGREVARMQARLSKLTPYFSGENFLPDPLQMP